MHLAHFILIFASAICAVQAEVVEPKPGTPERRAIMDAMRPAISKHVGKSVLFTGTVKESGDWALFEGNVGTEDGKKAHGDAEFELELDFLALLRREKGEWKLLYWGFAGDISAHVEARKRFPKVPKELMPEIPH